MVHLASLQVLESVGSLCLEDVACQTHLFDSQLDDLLVAGDHLDLLWCLGSGCLGSMVGRTLVHVSPLALLLDEIRQWWNFLLGDNRGVDIKLYHVRERGWLVLDLHFFWLHTVCVHSLLLSVLLALFVLFYLTLSHLFQLLLLAFEVVLLVEVDFEFKVLLFLDLLGFRLAPSLALSRGTTEL